MPNEVTPRTPLPMAVYSAAAVMAVDALQLAISVALRLARGGGSSSATDAMPIAVRSVFLVLSAALAVGLCRHRRLAWLVAVGLAAVRLSSYVVYPLLARRYLPEGGAAALWWESLPLQVVPLLTLVLLMLPSSRRAFAQSEKPEQA